MIPNIFFEDDGFFVAVLQPANFKKLYFFNKRSAGGDDSVESPVISIESYGFSWEFGSDSSL